MYRKVPWKLIAACSVHATSTRYARQRLARPFSIAASLWASLSLIAVHGSAQAQSADPAPLTAAPPPDAKALVEASKAVEAPKLQVPTSSTQFTLSSGGLLTSGNSRLLALTANGAFDLRREANGFGASVLANYGQGGPPGETVQMTALNAQGRVRYDRYVADKASIFLIFTGRHDRFQGLDFRLNVDPGFKYLFVSTDDSAFWAEAGYDFQHDIRRDAARVALDASAKPILDSAGNAELVDKTLTDHSSRLYLGSRHAFNKEVNLSGGVEYLQSFVDSTRYRLNFDALFAANLSGGLALGLGFSARFDHKPLSGKQDLDTATNVTLIYTFSAASEKPTAPPAAAPPAEVAPAAPSASERSAAPTAPTPPSPPDSEASPPAAPPPAP